MTNTIAINSRRIANLHVRRTTGTDAEWCAEILLLFTMIMFINGGNRNAGSLFIHAGVDIATWTQIQEHHVNCQYDVNEFHRPKVRDLIVQQDCIYELFMPVCSKKPPGFGPFDTIIM